MSLDDLPGPRNNHKRSWRMPKKARWYPLYTNNDDFKYWFDNLARGSPSTAIEYAKVLNRYIKLNKTTINALTETIKTDSDQFEKQLMGFIGKLEQKGYAPAYINNYLKIVTSWSSWHGVTPVRKIKISNKNLTPTLVNEQVPTIVQVNEIRANASTRGRICIGAVAYSGLRPEVLGHQRFEDGLKLGDLPELDIETLEFRNIPALVIVRQELSKAGHIYRSFFPANLCRDIEAYLKRRRDQGEKLTKDSALVAVAGSHRDKGQRVALGRSSGHIVAAIVSRDIRKAMRPTYDWRPYVLRSYFSTRLLLAVSNGDLNNNYRVYWMGHKGDMSAHYSSNKSVLPVDLVENMRAAFQRCSPYLVGGGDSEESLRRKMLLDTARMLGLDGSKVEAIEAVLDSVDSVEKAIKLISASGLMVTPGVDDQARLRDSLGAVDGEFIVVQGDVNLLEYVKQGYSFVKKVDQMPDASVFDEEWMTPGGEVMGLGDKVHAMVYADGNVELRGESDVLDELISDIEKLGIIISTKEMEPHYLLKRSSIE